MPTIIWNLGSAVPGVEKIKKVGENDCPKAPRCSNQPAVPNLAK